MHYFPYQPDCQRLLPAGRRLRLTNELLAGPGSETAGEERAMATQTSYDLMCRTLRSVLRDGVQGGQDGADGIRSVQFRASAALYGLLVDHPIDRWGRCRSCRRRGAVLGRTEPTLSGTHEGPALASPSRRSVSSDAARRRIVTGRRQHGYDRSERHLRVARDGSGSGTRRRSC